MNLYIVTWALLIFLVSVNKVKGSVVPSPRLNGVSSQTA